MKGRTLLQLFFVDFVIFLTGMGLLPLLPLYAEAFGAGPSDAGLYLGTTYAAITAGTLLTNTLSRRLGYRRLFFSAGLLGLLGLLLMGLATTFWQVVVLTAAIWFSGGIGIALVSVYTGLFAGQKSRGKSFGLTILSLPLASFVGGMTVGRLAEGHGYPAAFGFLALAWAAWPVVAVAGLKQWPAAGGRDRQEKGGRERRSWGGAFVMLLAVTLLASTSTYLIRLGTSYGMHRLGFSPGAISETSAIGGLATIPLTYASAALSDRFGRKGFLAVGSLLAGAAAVMLLGAGQLWHFFLATALAYISMNVIGAMGPAMAADLLPVEARGSGLPVLGAMRNIAGIIGFVSGGVLIDTVGISNLYLMAAALSVSAGLLLSRMQSGKRLEEAGPAAEARGPQGIPALSASPSKS